MSRLVLVLVLAGACCQREAAPTPTPGFAAPPPRDAPVAVDAPVVVDAPVLADAAVADAPPDASPKSHPKLGKHNDVCRTSDGRVVLACGPGLECCYPCGIAGCASVCHTHEECDVDAQRP